MIWLSIGVAKGKIDSTTECKPFCKTRGNGSQKRLFGGKRADAGLFLSSPAGLDGGGGSEADEDPSAAGLVEFFDRPTGGDGLGIESLELSDVGGLDQHFADGRGCESIGIDPVEPAAEIGDRREQFVEFCVESVDILLEKLRVLFQ